MPPRLCVSACLIGRACRYDGQARPDEGVRRRVAEVEAAGGTVVAVCPEEAGGLGTPRPAAWLSQGDGAAVLDGRARVVRVADGDDVTEAFVAGARACAEQAAGATEAILKARSPSCGVGRTWRDGEVGDGDGVFAALLRRRGLTLRGSEDPG